MRPATGGRWIVGILIVVPMILTQLIYVGFVISAGMSQARLYAQDGFSLTDYWVRSGAAGMLVRALLMLGLFSLFTWAAFGGERRESSRTRTLVALCAFAGWLCVLAVETYASAAS